MKRWLRLIGWSLTITIYVVVSALDLRDWVILRRAHYERSKKGEQP